MRIWSDGDDVQCSCFLPAPPIRVPSRAATTNMCPFKICGNGSESRLPPGAGITHPVLSVAFQKDTSGNGLRCHRGVGAECCTELKPAWLGRVVGGSGRRTRSRPTSGFKMSCWPSAAASPTYLLNEPVRPVAIRSAPREDLRATFLSMQNGSDATTGRRTARRRASATPTFLIRYSTMTWPYIHGCGVQM